MEVVIRTPHGQAEITIARVGEAAVVADLVARVTGSPSPPTVDVDGRAVLTTTPIVSCGVLTGSVIDLVQAPRHIGPDAVARLVQVAGWGAGASQALGPGRYRVGPGRRIHATELDLAHVDAVAFEVVVDEDGAARVSAHSPGVRIDGAEFAGTKAWSTGVLDVSGRAFELERVVARADRAGLADAAGREATVTFNRPPRPTRSRTAGGGARLDLFPHVAEAMRIAATGSPRLWATRPADAAAFQFAIGLDGLLPVTVDLRREHGVAFVGSTEFVRAAVRGMIVEACVQHGPADLDVVVLTDVDRAPVWEWVKWLPHARTSGPVQVLLAADQVATWVETTARRAGAQHLTLAVVDQPSWWRERAAPMRPLLNDRSRPVRVVALADSVDDVPAVCTTVVTERPAGLARIERLDELEVVDDFTPFLLAGDVAAAAARHLAAFEDPELDVPAALELPLTVSLPDLLGPASLAGATLAARWRAEKTRSSKPIPIGTARSGPVDLDLDRDGPHVLVGGAVGSGRSELLRSIVLALAAGSPPDDLALALLDVDGRSTFRQCASLPHVVIHHDISDAHMAARALRCLGAELAHHRDAASATGSPRLVIVVDEPVAMASEHGETMRALLAAVTGDEPHGVHLILATQRPAAVLAHTAGAAIRTRLALHHTDERESVALLGSRDAIQLSRRTPGRAWARLGSSEPVELQLALVSGASLADRERDLELRPYVVGRQLTPMELRIGRESSGAVLNDVGRLVNEIVAAATAVGQGRRRRLAPDPLPAILHRETLAGDAPRAGVPFAVVDLPDEGRQQVRWWEPGAGLLIYGGDGAGTTSTVATLAVGAAERYTADEVRLYVIDADTGALTALAGLPHTGGVVRLDDTGGVARLISVVSDVLHRRAGGMEPTPRIVVVIDDVGAVRRRLEARATLDEHWQRLIGIVRDGPAVGICTVATAKSERAMPASFVAAVPSRLVMRLDEVGSYVPFGFRLSDIPRFVPGRALDPADRTELQVVEPPGSLVTAVAALRAEVTHRRPPPELQP